ncbi:WD40 repeat domain-containing protein [Streptomyces sp. NPDC004111]|uniref:WD40 repeat domain-containing protein n=1 Tax=Streptomyces sp. NPDC004111 TaxID=3364690 RepID=UPI00369A53C8
MRSSRASRASRGRTWSVAVVAALAAVLAGAPGAAADEDGGFVIKDPRITESSGLAASRAHPGVYWTHNDQDGPYVYAVDGRTGETVARITLRGVGKPRDMEAISVGPDGAVYVGDIGDNLGGKWDHVWIYRFPEPKVLKDQTVDAAQYDVKYADGARNAEALMVHPTTGRAYIASKEESGAGLYEGPQKLTTGRTNVFRKIADVPWVTDGAFSPDGKRLVLRSYLGADVYDWKDGGRDLGEGSSLGIGYQGQSESVTYTLDGKGLLFGAEGERSAVTRLEVDPSAPSSPDGSATPPPGRTGATPAPADGEGLSASGMAVLAVLGVALLAWASLRGKRGGK